MIDQRLPVQIISLNKPQILDEPLNIDRFEFDEQYYLINDIYDDEENKKFEKLLEIFLITPRTKTIQHCHWEIKTLDILTNKLNFEFEQFKKQTHNYQHTMVIFVFFIVQLRCPSQFN